MAAVILAFAASSAATAMGAGVFMAGMAGMAGAYFGSKIDRKLFRRTSIIDMQTSGTRLSNLMVQASTYGKSIPIVYGQARIAGNVIWSRPIVEHTIQSTSMEGNDPVRVRRTNSKYTYTVSLAISICKGPISGVTKAWADSKKIDITDQKMFAVYLGDESQMPDSFISSFNKTDETPAYRGLAYVVIKDFALGEYGDRIPNFTFEIKRHVKAATKLEDKVTDIVLGQGQGTYLYDIITQEKAEGEQLTRNIFCQKGQACRLNQNTPQNKADVLVALDDMKSTLPSIQYVSVPICWFWDNKSQTLKPAVELEYGIRITPDAWRVGSYTDATASQIKAGLAKRPSLGTPYDLSISRLINELRTRKYEVMLVPKVFVYDSGHEISEEQIQVSDVNAFFAAYEAFVMHYAKFGANSLAIGSGKLFSKPPFSSTAHLEALVQKVKAIKPDTKVISSIYCETTGDLKRSVCKNADAIGIECYIPITNNLNQNAIHYQKVLEGWSNLGLRTFWQSNNQKPIWITEIAFGSVDAATNQPEVFADFMFKRYPVKSRGRIDTVAQRVALEATIDYLKTEAFIERKFIRYWSVLPYPLYPELKDTWVATTNWQKDCSLQGKLGVVSLRYVVEDLLSQVGHQSYDASLLTDIVRGYVIDSKQSVRASLEQLASAYFFDVVESGGTLKFIRRGNESKVSIDVSECVSSDSSTSDKGFTIVRLQELELPRQVDVVFLDIQENYETGTVSAVRQTVNALESVTISLPIALNKHEAQRVADTTLLNAWVSRTQYKFTLPTKYVSLEPTDVITVYKGQDKAKQEHLMRIVSTRNMLTSQEISAVSEDISIYDAFASEQKSESQSKPNSSSNAGAGSNAVPKTELLLLDLPAIDANTSHTAELKYAIYSKAEGWRGAAVYAAFSKDGEYAFKFNTSAQSIVGSVLNSSVLSPAKHLANHYTWDKHTTVDVLLLQGELTSTTKDNVLRGANLCLVGDELIQFQYATFLDTHKYRLSQLLRGRKGTEHAIGQHQNNERFVLLNHAIAEEAIPSSEWGSKHYYKAVTVGGYLVSTDAVEFTYMARGLKPYAPCHVRCKYETSGNIRIEWKRRTRINGDWLNLVDAPLSEEREMYDVEIYSDKALKRTFNQLQSPTVVYTKDQQIQDGIQISLRAEDEEDTKPKTLIQVYQLSNLVGRGQPGSLSL